MSHPPEPAGEYTPEPPPVYRPDDGDQPTLDVDQPTLYQPPFLQNDQPTVYQPPAPVFPSEPHPGVFPVSPTPSVMSAPPISTPPMYSGPPISGTPVTGYGERPRPAGRRKIVGVLSGVIVLLFVAAAVMTGLFVSEHGDYAAAKKKADSVSTKEQKISELNSQLTSAKSDLEKTKQQLAGSQSQGKDLEEQKKIVATCLKLTFDFLNTLSQGTEESKAKAQTILEQMRQPCNQAEPYIGN